MADRIIMQMSDGSFTNTPIPVSTTSTPLPSGAAQDGTDAAGTNAGTQAGNTTPGVGIRGWLSTLAGIFQSVGAKIQGLGTAGTPSGGVVSVQGVGGGTALPVSFTQPALVASTAAIGSVITHSFSKADNIVRPANATPYTAQQSINCNVVVTALVSISGNTVTLTAANAFAVGDYITVAGVNGNFTNATNIDGNWVCIAGTNATTVVFVTALTPTGTPATATHGTIAKLLAFDVGDAVGHSIILSELRVTLEGVAMTGALRAYLYTQQVGVLVDQSAFTVLIANYASRRDYYDLYPVTEGSGSDCTMATIRLWEDIVLDPADTHVFLRLVTEAASTPVSGGHVYARLTGVQLGG